MSLDRAIALHPSDADLYYGRSLVRAKKGDGKGAAADLVAVRGLASIIRALAQFPPIVAEEVADLIKGCPRVPTEAQKRVRLDEIVYQVSLSGPGYRWPLPAGRLRCIGRRLGPTASQLSRNAASPATASLKSHASASSVSPQHSTSPPR
jgi:hypothetical protein